MAKNFVQGSANITVTAPATVTSGDGVLVGTLFGVALHDAASGALVEIATDGVYTLPKTSALAIAVGDRVFWTGTEVDKTLTAQVCIGIAVSVAADPSPSVNVRLGAQTAAGA